MLAAINFCVIPPELIKSAQIVLSDLFRFKWHIEIFLIFKHRIDRVFFHLRQFFVNYYVDIFTDLTVINKALVVRTEVLFKVVAHWFAFKLFRKELSEDVL